MMQKIAGKNVNIPDKEIEQSMKVLGLTKEEAIQMWLEDNGYEENAEQEALDAKAKANRVTATVHKAKAEGKERKPRERKPNEEKREIIQKLFEGFPYAHQRAEIKNPERQIDFYVGENHYSITLTLHRPPKDK